VLALVGIVGLVALVPVSAGAITPPSGLFQPLAPTHHAATLTRDGSDTYGLRASARNLTVTGSLTNVDSNSRGVFWPRDQVPSARQQSCVTLTGKVGVAVQMGLALRIAKTPSGALRAITITNHVFGNPLNLPTWAFNVHVWRSDLVPAFRHVTTFNLASTLGPNGVALPFPWRLCARVQGRLLMFQAWRVGEPAPTWGDTSHGGSVQLPAGSGYAGYAGGYVGHLFGGNSASYRDLATGEPTAVPQ
jgi:hypothetical protein